MRFTTSAAAILFTAALLHVAAVCLFGFCVYAAVRLTF